jgi:hypothetical protein
MLSSETKFAAGNQFWKLRAKSGRSKIWEDPNELWEDCMDYFETTAKRTWTQIQYVGKDAERVEIPASVPYTMSGLFLFLDIVHTTWMVYETRSDFKTICTRVRDVIYTQKFEGAAVGAFNSNLMSRDLGLRDIKETHKVRVGVEKEKETYED